MAAPTDTTQRPTLGRYFLIGLAVGAGIAVAMLVVNFAAAGLVVGLGAVVDTQ